MKIKSDVLINEMDGQYVVVDAREGKERFNGIMKMNKTAGFVTKLLEKEISLDEIVEAMVEKYDVSEEEARKNAEKVIDSLQSIGLME